MSDATHARGCRSKSRPSAIMDGYDFCPKCRRLIARQGETPGAPGVSGTQPRKVTR